MQATIVYWGYIGMMEKKMETTIKLRASLPCTFANGRQPFNKPTCVRYVLVKHGVNLGVLCL